MASFNSSSLFAMKHEPVRIQKFLSSAGIASRRTAEQLILEGEVTVNGRPAELGQKVTPEKDHVKVRGKMVRGPTKTEPVTLALNKPKGYLCSHDDPHHEKIIYSLVPEEFADRRFLCAGRLDLNSEGLVILTTDGDLANQLMHPSAGVIKRYRVSLNRPFPAKKIPALLRGVRFEGEILKAEKALLVSPDKKPDESTDLEIHLHHGKKREIRRLFETLGHHVKRLKRYQIGAYSVRGIPRGAVRPLSQDDIRKLFLP